MNDHLVGCKAQRLIRPEMYLSMSDGGGDPRRAVSKCSVDCVLMTVLIIYRTITEPGIFKLTLRGKNVYAK